MAFGDQGNLSLNRMALLRKQGIRFVYQRVEEKELGGYDLRVEASIKKVYSNGRATILKVE